MTLDLEALTAVAKAATGGEWVVREDDNEHRCLIGANINADGTMRGDGMRNGGIWVVETKGPDCALNAAHIAAFNPATCEALIEEVKRLRGVVAPFAEHADSFLPETPWALEVPITVMVGDLKEARAALPSNEGERE